MFDKIVSKVLYSKRQREVIKICMLTMFYRLVEVHQGLHL